MSSGQHENQEPVTPNRRRPNVSHANSFGTIVVKGLRGVFHFTETSSPDQAVTEDEQGRLVVDSGLYKRDKPVAMQEYLASKKKIEADAHVARPIALSPAEVLEQVMQADQLRSKIANQLPLFGEVETPPEEPTPER